MEEAKLMRPVFAESAVQMLHAASQGIPRVVNQICSQALKRCLKRRIRTPKCLRRRKLAAF